MARNPQSLDDGRPPRGYKWWRFVERHLPIIVIYLMVATLVGFVVAPNVIITVPTGHVGVLWKRFRGGTQLDPRALKEEGLRILLPWDKLFQYDLRLQNTADTYNAISKDGVNLSATINIRFRLKHDAIPQLHQTIGPDYLAKLVKPEIGNRAREIIAEYSAEEVYSTKRQEIQKRIRTHTEAMLGQSMLQRKSEESEYGEHYRIPMDAILNLYDTLVLSLVLPTSVVEAINRKVEQYYLVQEYGFRVDRERKESERKRIEAEGISAFQQIVSQGINESYLRWRGIEATLQLSQSPNTKIVIVGSGKDGLPIILGNVDSPAAPRTGAAPPTDGTGGGRERSTAASPPLLERMPAINLPTPHERPPPTAAPRPPVEPPPGATTGAPPPGGPGPGGPAPGGPAPGGHAPGGAAPGPGQPPGAPGAPGKQSSSWVPSMSDIQALVSKVVGSSEPGPPTASRPGGAPGASPGPAPAHVGPRPEAAAPPHAGPGAGPPR
jgi:regulator of protease activity HflC (stomatin/prohibitin superfamily)